MPDTIGNITVPEITPSGTYPLTPDYGSVQAIEPEIVVHAFGSANAKIEQRFYLGNGVRRFRLVHDALTNAEYDSLRDFFDAKKGPEGLFTFDFPEPDGSTTPYTCYFVGGGLTVTRESNIYSSVQVELAGVPSSAPTYTLNATETRFPGATLKAAMLAQVQELIPLIKIQPREPGYPAIYVSDRRCTVGGQLYQARALGWSGISQSLSTIGASDQAQFTFGNADRVMRDLAGDTNLWRADIEFSIFHVGSGIKLDFWKGFVNDFSGEESTEFTLSASDGLYQLTLDYPARKVSRTCWKKFDDGAACPYTSVGTPGFTACDKSFAACEARGMADYHGGINVRPQGVRTKDNSTGTWGMGRQMLTSFSLVNDSVYGFPLQEIYTDAEMPVNCMIAAGREEGDYYSAIGIVGAGPIGAYAADGSKHRLDGSAAHGPLPLGLRRSLGHDPVQNNDPDADSQEFSIDGGTFSGDRAAGVAFVQIRRSDVKGLQLSRATEHEMQVVVGGGMGGWYWTNASTRLWATQNTSLVWIAVNALIRAHGLENASAAAQTALFDVDSAIAAAAICSDVVNVMFGAGTETQFRFRGSIKDPKPLGDWIQEILNNGLCYTTNVFGKLRFGIRINSSVVEAFTAGNIILDSLRLASNRPDFNEFAATYADEEFNYSTNTVSLYDEAHRDTYGKSAQSINLVGTFTKSQAARIVTTRLREELGGITEAEWTKARHGSFRTTVLALNVEPGTVCSLTHEDMPGGAGEFRVQRVVLNDDWSVDVEWRTTTDSMYDMAVGPKPADVPADAVPGELVIDLVPGDVQPIGANDFDVTQSDDGISVYFDISYSPPGTDSSDMGTFAGIAATIEAPDASGALFFTGNHDYNGDPDGAGAARYGTARLVLPLPAAGEDWRILIASRSLVYRKPVVLSGAGATPSRVVTVVGQSVAVEPPAGAAGVEYAALVTAFSAAVAYGVSEAGAQTFQFTGSWTEPADAAFRGVVIFARPSGGTGSTDRILAMNHKGDTTLRTDFWTVPETSEGWTLYACSFDKWDRVNTIAGGTTPSVALTVQRQAGTSGQEYAPFVTGQAAAIAYGQDEAGDTVYAVLSSWTNPASSTYGGVRIVAVPSGDFAAARVLAIEMDGSTQVRSGPWAVPNSTVNWRIYFVSMDTSNRVNTIVDGSTPHIDATVQPQVGGSGVEYSALVTGFSAAAYYTVDEAGDERYGFAGGWTLPGDVSKFRGVKIVARPPTYPTDKDIELAIETAGSIAFRTSTWPVPGSSEAWTLYAVSIDANNRANSITGSTPSAAVTVVRQGNGGSGVEYAPLVTGFSASVQTSTNESGVARYRFEGSWTLPGDVTRFRGVKIVARPSSGADRVLAIETAGITAFKTDDWPMPESTESWTLYAVSIDANNRANSITGGTPSQALSVTPSGTGTLKLNRAAAASFNTTEFEIVSSAFRIKDLSADKITTGTIRVGGGGGKPGQLGVFDASSNLVAWAGQQSSYYGIWGKNLWAGGTSPADAPLYVDGSGNVVLASISGKHPSFALNSNGVTTVLNNATFAPAGVAAGLTVTNNTTSRKAVVADDYIALYNGSNFRVTLFQSASDSSATCDATGGSTASISATSGGAFLNLTPGSGLSAQINLGSVSSLPTGVSGRIVNHSGTLKWYNGSSWQSAGGGTGTVTSVALSLPSEITVSGSPVTTSGTLTGSWASQTANRVFCAPNGSPGTPTFRALAIADLPSTVCTTDTSQTISATKTVSGTLDVHGGSGVLKIRQRGDSNGIPSSNNNELFAYWDTGLSGMRLVYRDSAGTGYALDF